MSYEYSLGYFVQRLGANPSLPATLHLDTDYLVKPGLHCSLIAVKKIIPHLMQHDQLSDIEAEQRAMVAAEAALAEAQPHFAGYRPDFRIADQPDRGRHTLLVMADVPGLDRAFAILSARLQLDIPVQPAHVTLYTVANGLPIGITSPAELTQWTRPLTPAELDQLQNQIDLPAALHLGETPQTQEAL